MNKFNRTVQYGMTLILVYVLYSDKHMRGLAIVPLAALILIGLLLRFRFKSQKGPESTDTNIYMNRLYRNTFISGLVLYVFLVPYLYFGVWGQPADFPFAGMILSCYWLCYMIIFPIGLYRMKKKRNNLQFRE